MRRNSGTYMLTAITMLTVMQMVLVVKSCGRKLNVLNNLASLQNSGFEEVSPRVVVLYRFDSCLEQIWGQCAVFQQNKNIVDASFVLGILRPDHDDLLAQ